MKRLQNNRKTLGLLLAFLLVLPFAIKTEHVYHCSVYDDGEHSHHDCSTCVTCCFTYPLFIENEPLEFKIIPQYVEFEIPVFDSQITASFLFPYHLRAPPFRFPCSLV